MTSNNVVCCGLDLKEPSITYWTLHTVGMCTISMDGITILEGRQRKFLHTMSNECRRFVAVSV
jgi:hypothetical protein